MMLSIGLCAQVACIWEATARKSGNVHRFCDFNDCGYVDFLLSAAAVAPALEKADGRSVGVTVLEAVRATRQVVATNTNLGILLLLAPLAAVPRGQDLRAGLLSVLGSLTLEDSHAVYEAIRLAGPGGLAKVREQDVSQAPTLPLGQIMALAAERDLIARQYVDGFQEVLDDGVPALLKGFEKTPEIEAATIHCHLHLLAGYPDSLIARKRGQGEAEEASRRAADVLATGWPHRPEGEVALAEFDAWLRAVGHARNPGTTADLVTACLFVALREGLIQLPRDFAIVR